MGGEKSGAWWIIILFLGSPPHRRGKEYDDPTQNELIGITPAWAGKRCSPAMQQTTKQDHPRVGGEKTKSIHPYPVLDGSPPRGRGKADVLFSQFFARRITPAWAGKRPGGIPSSMVVRDHPRVGGEKARWYPIKYGGQGSPPHGRGKVPAVLQCRRFRGITPAWAGKSSGQHNASLVNKDHPRVGGEKDNAEFREKIDQGSPQRGRGKDVLILDGAGVVGITPAWAGKRCLDTGWCGCSRDHPRVGGEKWCSVL